jgi:hypothetical protein
MLLGPVSLGLSNHGARVSKTQLNGNYVLSPTQSRKPPGATSEKVGLFCTHQSYWTCASASRRRGAILKSARTACSA